MQDLRSAVKGGVDPNGLGSSVVAADVLWSDPVADPGLRSNTARGVGLIFGPDVTQVLEPARHGLGETSIYLEVHLPFRMSAFLKCHGIQRYTILTHCIWDDGNSYKDCSTSSAMRYLWCSPQKAAFV